MSLQTPIFDLNAWLMPLGISAENKVRIDRLINFIERNKPPLVTLQEVWLGKYVNYLKEKLPRYLVVASSLGSAFNWGGMVTLLDSTKVSYKSHSYTYFPQQGIQFIHERIAHKGVLTVVVSIGGQEWKITNTHLFAPHSLKQEDITISQFLRLPRPTSYEDRHLLCGDLNLDPEKVYRIAAAAGWRIDCNLEPTISRDNPYQLMLANRFNNNTFKCDYILFPGGNLQTEVIREELSDHYGLWTEI